RALRAARVEDRVVADLVAGSVHLAPPVDVLHENAAVARRDVERAAHPVAVEDRNDVIQLRHGGVVKAQRDRGPLSAGPSGEGRRGGVGWSGHGRFLLWFSVRAVAA